jgi:D-sedoheptulose 7-phosphate isomerase
MDWIVSQIEQSRALTGGLLEDQPFLASLDRICRKIVHSLENGGKLLTLGNGGSATDALHLAEELTGRYRSNRKPLPAICLAADAPALTCIANDFGFEQIFSRQIGAFCLPGDIVAAFSTSGKSENIVQALKAGREKGGLTVGLLGCGGGPALDHCDEALIVPHTNTARIQEVHALALHIICEAVERRFGLK